MEKRLHDWALGHSDSLGIKKMRNSNQRRGEKEGEMRDVLETKSLEFRRNPGLEATDLELVLRARLNRQIWGNGSQSVVHTLLGEPQDPCRSSASARLLHHDTMMSSAFFTVGLPSVLTLQR